jgi:hypothetical protein
MRPALGRQHSSCKYDVVRSGAKPTHQALANQRPFAGTGGSPFAGCASERTLIG